MLNSIPFKRKITLVAAMKMASLLMDPTIKLFCHTQRTVHADCLKEVIRNFDELQKMRDWLLENCLEMKARICGIKVYTLKFSYCFGIHLAHLILSHTDSLSQTLQGIQTTPVRACVTTISNQFVLKMNSIYFGRK